MYETDFTKGVYKLEDFCNALKNNNCIVVRNVFNDWRALVGSTKYDSIRFVITAVHGEMKFGFWIACKHDLIITDYAKQQWLDFFCLTKETENVWENLLKASWLKPTELLKASWLKPTELLKASWLKPTELLFCSAVKPVESFDDIEMENMNRVEDRNRVEDLMYELNAALDSWNGKGEVNRIILLLESLVDVFKEIEDKEKNNENVE